MNSPKDFTLPAILADLKAKHPDEQPDRLAAAATFLYEKKLATADHFGRVTYKPDAAFVAPRCRAVKLEELDEATLQRALEGKVWTPDEPSPVPQRNAYAPVPAAITEADALERRYAAILDAMNEGDTIFDRRENGRRTARELADAGRADGSAALERLQALGGNGYSLGPVRK